MTELALATALAVVAISGRIALLPQMGLRAPFALVFVAVVCATLLGGWRSGVAATLIGQVLAWYILIEPAYSVKLLSGKDAASLGIVTLCQLVIVAVVWLYQRQIDKHERVRDTLVNELNHRVKNTLAIVQSLAHQTLRRAPSDEVALFERRLQALAGAHDLLTSRDWGKSSFKELIEDALRPFAFPADRLSISGPEVSVPPTTAVNLTLVVHELATNAVKHGAMSNGSGRIDIKWSDGDNLPDWFEWREGGGPKVVPPKRKGFGTRLIQRGLAAELGVKVNFTFEPDGLVCRVEAGPTRAS